jgi:hypothetical protein
MKWPDRLMVAGAFLCCFGGYLFLKGPAVNVAQLSFRVGLLAVGLVLGAIGLFLKVSEGK